MKFSGASWCGGPRRGTGTIAQETSECCVRFPKIEGSSCARRTSFPETLRTKLEGIENKRFPKLGDSCWANVLLKEDFEGCGRNEKETELRQPLTGRTNIQLPISTIDILSSNHELEYKFGSQEYLVSYSLSSKNCSDVSGWGERPSER